MLSFFFLLTFPTKTLPYVSAQVDCKGMISLENQHNKNSNTAWKMSFEIQAVIFEQNLRQYSYFYRSDIKFLITGGIFLQKGVEKYPEIPP